MKKWKDQINILSDKPLALILSALAFGIIAGILQHQGNPQGSGLCLSCFLRDWSGALGFHNAEGGRYFRPEPAGIILGSTLSAILFGEFKSRGGTAPLLRFFLGICAAVGTLTFLGCPTGILSRFGTGNLYALLAIPSMVAGIALGARFKEKGFDLGKMKQPIGLDKWIGLGLVILPLGLVLLSLSVADNYAPFFSWDGPASERAPKYLSLTLAIFLGFLAQRTRLCSVSAVQNWIWMKDRTQGLAMGFLILGSLLSAILLGGFKWVIPSWGDGLLQSSGLPGWQDYIRGILGALLAGLAFSLAGGCTLRNLVLAGQGESDSWMFLGGMLAGSALMYNYGLWGRPVCGTLVEMPPQGIFVIILCLSLCIICGLRIRPIKEKI